MQKYHYERLYIEQTKIFENKEISIDRNNWRENNQLLIILMAQASQAKGQKGASLAAASATQSTIAQRRFEIENSIEDEQLFTWD